ncbi:patched family domain-containing protein [Ditylenchus destructor]|nr:patched family domain-containing protein [Ditylenchus destructor]
MSQHRGRYSTFDVYFISLFFRWGLIVHKLRWILFISPFLLTAFLAFGFVWIRELTTNDPQFVFSPDDAYWRFERGVLSEHWPLDEQRFWPGKSYDYNGYVDVIAAGIPDKELGRPNMLLSRYLNELDRINQYIIYNLTVSVEHEGLSYEVGFTDLCMSYDWKCYLNDHLTMLQPKHKWGTFNAEIADFAKSIIETEVKITYPIGWRGTEPIYFGALVGGVHLTDAVGHFDYVKAVRLTYNVRDGQVGNVSKVWRKKVAEYLTNKNVRPSDVLEFGMYHNESLYEGLKDVADELNPKFALTSTILFIFCVGCSIVLLSDEKERRLVGIDWVRSKPILGLAALICPMMAVVSAFGLLLWLGVIYNEIVNVSPFIVLSVGLDDAFIMTASWHRTNPQLSVARRLAEALAEAAVSITITSVTDMLTFGIGCYTTLPGVRLFCMYTFWGITFTYLYQITYFAAVMAFAGKHALFGIKTLKLEQAETPIKKYLFSGSVCRQEENESKSLECEESGLKRRAGKQTDKSVRFDNVTLYGSDPKITSEAESKTEGEKETVSLKNTIKNFLKSMESAQHEWDEKFDSHHCKETFVNRLFREVYGPFLLTTRTQLYILFFYAVYATGAIYGLTQVKEGLNPKNLVRNSFYLADFYELIDETFWEEGLQMQVVVNNAPDLFAPSQRQQIGDMISAFENTPYTMKHNATMIWLDAFEAKLRSDWEEFNNTLPETSAQWYQRCQEWLLTAGGRRLWELDMVWERNETNPTDSRVKAFRFQVGLRNYKTPTDHTNSCKLMRDIAEHYRQFNVTTFHEYYPFADQYLELKPALYRNCILALLCMMFVSFVMIPNLAAAFVITAAIISIDIGVIGYMALWGINLESVSMITIIMSIGFSVDLSAHITYAFVKSEGTNDEKAIAALETLGWPVFLGAFSTVVGISVLMFVDATIVNIFVKTVLLVITFSLLHGIVFLPLLLIVALPRLDVECCNVSKKNEMRKKENSNGENKT